jgi:hypothetical protein
VEGGQTGSSPEREAPAGRSPARSPSCFGALETAQRQCSPRFRHHPAQGCPPFSAMRSTYKLFAGSGWSSNDPPQAATNKVDSLAPASPLFNSLGSSSLRANLRTIFAKQRCWPLSIHCTLTNHKHKCKGLGKSFKPFDSNQPTGVNPEIVIHFWNGGTNLAPSRVNRLSEIFPSLDRPSRDF